jgi:hypothetical protein
MYLVRGRQRQHGACERKTVDINFSWSNSGVHQRTDGARTILRICGLCVNVSDRNQANKQDKKNTEQYTGALRQPNVATVFGLRHYKRISKFILL